MTPRKSPLADPTKYDVRPYNTPIKNGVYDMVIEWVPVQKTEKQDEPQEGSND